MHPKAIEHVLKWEGGYVNDRRDPGGETKYGISKRAYPNEDILDLTKARAEFLYDRDYWRAMGCDKMPDGVALLVFDTAVNCGVKRTKGWIAEVGLDLAKLAVRRAFHYATLDHLDDTYGKGWFNRLFDTYTEALRLQER